MASVGAARAFEAFESHLRAYVGSRVEPGWVDDVVAEVLLRLVSHESDLARAENPLA